MLVLTATTDNIQAVLAGSVTTNQPQCVTSWRDITTTAYTPGRTVINTNNTTDVNIVAAPAASTQRVVDLINIYNKDTAAATVTVKFDANGTEYILWKGSLAAGESVQYVEGRGWTVLSPDGVPKTESGSGGGSATPLAYLDTTIVYNNVDTLADTDLEVTVEAGGKYEIDVAIFTDSVAQPLNLDFGGTAGIANFICEGHAIYSGLLASQGRLTSAGAGFTDSSAGGLPATYIVKGSVEISTAGTLNIRGAQRSADASDTTILEGSTLKLTPVS